jgi:hypothetical protein
MRSYDELVAAHELITSGLNDCQVARVTGIPRSTVRDWRLGKRQADESVRASCIRCAGPVHDFDALPDSYAYLLGLYLGDGCLSEGARRVFRLRIALDGVYPGIISECMEAMRELLPDNRQHVQPIRGSRGVEVGTHSRQLICLFPQHGPGPKHQRRIVLVPWQHAITSRRPDLLLRGFIHSDGCRFTNTIRHAKKTYEYPRYNFSNRSDDIKGIFCEACDMLGIEWRVMNRWTISVARRASVARLDEFVGPKA